MKLVTAKQMRELDSASIERHGISSLSLMERAGEGLADAVLALMTGKTGHVVVISGKGNNGGDGLVAARHLLEKGYDVSVIMLTSPTDLSPDSRANWEMLAQKTQRIFTVQDNAELNSHRTTIANASCIVDAILGTGLAGEVSGVNAHAIELINSFRAPIISADIPSGLSADTGLPLGMAVCAKKTLTFGLPKLGLFIGKGPEHSGDVTVVDIGIPQEEVEKVAVNFFMIEPSMFRKYFGKRDQSSHKGSFGHVVVFSGSRGHMGAGYLSSMAALRAGAGLVSYALPEAAFVRFDATYAEVMCEPIPDAGAAYFRPEGIDRALRVLEKKSVAVIGPAIGTEAPTKEFVNRFVKEANIPLVIDADALNVLDLSALSGRRNQTIITPHPGEMARLIGKDTAFVQARRTEVAMELAKRTGAIVVLKGKNTVVAEADGRTSINTTGNAGMATAGMGDALTGIIASFIAQGIPPADACIAAVHIHGIAGDIAAAEHGERSLITSDVIRRIGDAVKRVENWQ